MDVLPLLQLRALQAQLADARQQQKEQAADKAALQARLQAANNQATAHDAENGKLQVSRLCSSTLSFHRSLVHFLSFFLSCLLSFFIYICYSASGNQLSPGQSVLSKSVPVQIKFGSRQVVVHCRPPAKPLHAEYRQAVCSALNQCGVDRSPHSQYLPYMISAEGNVFWLLQEELIKSEEERLTISQALLTMQLDLNHAQVPACLYPLECPGATGHTHAASATSAVEVLKTLLLRCHAGNP